MSILLILIGVFMILVFVNLIFIMSRYKKCPPDKLLVIYGRVDPEGKEDSLIVRSGATFIWPVIQSYAFLDLVDYEHKIEGYFKGKEQKDVFVKGKLSYRISNDDALAKLAAKRLMGKSQGEIKKTTTDYVDNAIRDVFLGMTENEARTNDNKLTETTKQKIEEALSPLGMVVNHLRIEVN